MNKSRHRRPVLDPQRRLVVPGPERREPPTFYNIAVTRRQLFAVLFGLGMAGILILWIGFEIGRQSTLLADRKSAVVPTIEAAAQVPETEATRENDLPRVEVKAEVEDSIDDLPEPDGKGEDSIDKSEGERPAAAEGPAADAAPAGTFADRLLAGGRASIESAPEYDASFFKGGDPGAGRGSGVDLVWRAFRSAGVDLPALVHRDVARAPEVYGASEANPDLDHRRLRYLARFFSRHALSLPTAPTGDWQRGDVVIWGLEGDASRAKHIGLVSDRRGPDGRPFVIHHKRPDGEFSGRPSEDDVLFRWPVAFHFRWTRSD